MKRKRNPRFILDSDITIDRLGELARQGWPDNIMTVEVVPPKRTADQNRMFWELYGEIAKQKGDESAEDIWRYCKLHHGIPILRRDDPTFGRWYDQNMKSMEYPIKLEAMRYMSVTSDFSKKQGSEYIDNVIREFSQQGIYLLTKDYY